MWGVKNGDKPTVMLVFIHNKNWKAPDTVEVEVHCDRPTVTLFVFIIKLWYVILDLIPWMKAI